MFEAVRHGGQSDELQHPGSSLRQAAPVFVRHQTPGLELEVASPPERDQSSPAGRDLSPGGSVQSNRQSLPHRHKASTRQGNILYPLIALMVSGFSLYLV